MQVVKCHILKDVLLQITLEQNFRKKLLAKKSLTRETTR